ncbi:MAG TPA: glycoside hydrolase family 3 protein, partial [Longimicrobiales bacterium]|nr:glycoside hydrolase family 3 protein [Longimicrobiales bacterium]
MVLLSATLVAGCGGGPAPDVPGPAAAEPEVGGLPTEHREGEFGPLPDVLDADARSWVDETLASLTLPEAVGQLVIQWIDGAHLATSGPEFEQLRGWTEEVGIGGFYLSIGTPHAYAAKVNELQRRARVPLLFVSDFEDGGPGMRLSRSYALPSLLPQGGGTEFPPTMAFGAAGDERLAREYGRITGEEARAVGIRLNFAPVLDVNSNPDNPVIATRSFGGDPELVARMGAAFVEGSRAVGVMATAKHFPGHGDTGVDSHLALPSVDADRTRLDTLELVPFQRAIDVGVDAVMTAHVALPAVLGEGAPPATLAPEVLTGLLREEMGFGGILVTDALTMGAISRTWGTSEAAVLALEAGADILLSPGDVTGVVDAVVEAVRSGRVPESRVRRSTRRILEAKARTGLHRDRLVDVDRVDAVVGAAAHLALADTVAERSMVLVRDRRRAVPFRPGTRRVVSVTFTSDRDLPAGRAFDGALRAGREGEGNEPLDVRSFRMTPSSSASAWAVAGRALGDADAVV